MIMKSAQIQHEAASGSRAAIPVLIVDDSSIMQDRLKSWLEAIGGYQVVGQIQDAAGIEDTIRDLLPQIIIMDMRLPGGGVQTLRRIVKDGQYPIVIMFTAFATAIHRARCLEWGADYFFDKTADLKIFQETLIQLKKRILLEQPE